jgi:hypothetical protein
VIYSIPARGFTAAVSVFGGTPPPKPLKCKSVANQSGPRLCSRWANPTGEKPELLCAKFSFAADIIETSLIHPSQMYHLWLLLFHHRFRKTKTLLTRGKQGRKVGFRFVTCLPPGYPNQFPGLARDTTWIAQG